MNPYEETFRTWNKIAQLYQDTFMDLALYDDTYEAFCKLLPKEHAAILEVGCGPGNISRYLLNKYPGLEILGIDIAPNMIDLARKNNPEAAFEVMDCRDIEQLPGQYDGIICGFCLPYLSKEDSRIFLKSSSRLLHQGAPFYLSFVEGDYRQSGFISGNSGDRVYFYYYALRDLEQALLENHFELIRVFDIAYDRKGNPPDTHRIILAQKK